MLNFYHVKEDYIAYLRTKEEKVLYNKSEHRPYVGVVLMIHGIPYYVPLASPKPKHKTMSNGLDFRKIDGGACGAINFNNMIPVPDDCLIPINFSECEAKQANLFRKQYRKINAEKDLICSTAQTLYDICTKDSSLLSTHERAVKMRCCDFQMLEELCKKYECVHLEENFESIE